MRQTVLIALGCLCLAGCGGQFDLAAPDPVAAVGQEAPMVVRLRRFDVFYVPVPQRETCIRFVLSDTQQAAITDKEGYAGVGLRAPQRPGIYPLTLAVLAREGEEVVHESRFYVWAKERTVVAVDLDGLPHYGSSASLSARAALVQLAARSNIVYLTERPLSDHARAHRTLYQCGYPDGPVVLWQSKRWQMVSRGGVQVPEILWGGRMVSQLPLLRQQFPGLNVGLCVSAKAAEGFREANLRAVVVGRSGASDAHVTYCRDWADLAAMGL